MNDFEIRRSRSDDAEAIADVHLDSRREATPWLPILHSREETVTYFTDVLLGEDVLVAQADRIVVGFIALLCDHIDHLYIAQAYQHRRIGDKLLAIAKELHPDGRRYGHSNGTRGRADSMKRAVSLPQSSPTACVMKKANLTCCTHGAHVHQAVNLCRRRVYDVVADTGHQP